MVTASRLLKEMIVHCLGFVLDERAGVQTGRCDQRGVGNSFQVRPAARVSKKRGECKQVRKPEGTSLGRQRVKKVDLEINLEKYSMVRW